MAHKRDLLLVGGGRFVAIIFGLIAIRAMTTFLTPAQYGQLALLISVQMFCGLFLVNPIGQHINLHTHAWWDEGSLIVRLRSYRYYVLAVALVGALVATILIRQQTAAGILLTAIVVFAMVASATWNATLIPMLNMLGFRGASVFWSTVTVCTGLIASIILVSFFPGAIAWFGGQTIGMSAGALGANIVLRRSAGMPKAPLQRASLIDRAGILKYCFPLAVATGLMWMQVSGYRFLIERNWGIAQLGFLVVGLQLAAQVWALAESLAMQFLYPLFFRRITESAAQRELKEAYSDLLNTLVPVYLLLTGMLIMGAPSLLKLLVASKFNDAVIFVVLGAWIELFRVLGNILSNAAHAKRATKSLTTPYAVGSIVALGLIALAGSAHLSLIWSAAALVAGGASTFLVMLIGMHKQIQIVPDMPRIGLAAIAMVLVASLLAWRPGVPGWGGAIVTLVIACLATVCGLVCLLRKNPALDRMLAVKLRKN